MQFLHQLNKGVRSLFVHIVVFKGTQSTNAIKYMVPGHKPRSKNNLNVQANQAAAAVSTDSPSQNLTLSQVQQLIALLSSQLHAGDSISSEIVQPIASFSSIHGILSLSSISNSHQFSHSCWVLDTGDKHHISCTLDLTQGVTTGESRQEGNLYFLESSKSVSLVSQISVHCNNVSLSSTRLWHYRLGHPPYVKLNMMSNELRISLDLEIS